MLYRKYYPLFMPICMSYTRNSDDASDIFNRAMLKVFQSLSTYGGKGSFAGWIRKIVVNESIDFLRREARFNANCSLEELDTVSFDPELIARMDAEKILDAIRALPGTYRLVVNLYIVEGYTHKEIAEQLSISEGTSKWYLNQARKTLREELVKMGYEIHCF